MKKNIKYNLKGSSLVEVLIALAITSFCASLAVIIYLNIQRSSVPFFKVKAVELAEMYMNKTLEERTFTDEEIYAEEFTVKKSSVISENFPDCSLIRIIVFDGSKKKLYELESLVNVSFYTK